MSKNLKVLLRKKTSAFIIIFGPLLVMLLVGMAFNNQSSYNINIGVFSSQFSNTSNLFVSELSKQFDTIVYDNQEKCVSDVRQRSIHACIVFPANMKISNEVSNEIVFYLDESNVNLAWVVSKSISDVSMGKSSELSLEMTNVLLSRLDMTKNFLSNQSDSINQLLAKNSQLSSTTSSIQSSANSFDAEDLESLSTDVKSLDTYATDLVNVSKKLIDDINKAANGLPDESSEKGKILSLTKSAKTNVDSINSNINKIDLSKTDTLVSNITSSQKDILSKSSSVVSDLSASVSILNSVGSSIKNLNTSIENIEVTSAANIVSPIKTKIEPVIAESTHLSYMFPGLLVLVIMFVCILLSCSIVISEKTSSAFFRTFTAPTRNIVFVLGNFLTIVLLLVVQIAIILSVSYWIFDINIVPNLAITLLILLVLVVLFILVGMLIGTLLSTEEMAMLASISVSSVLLFLSNMILPLESMPNYVSDVAKFNPFVIGESLLKKSILFKFDIYTLSNDIYLLLAYIAVIFILIILLQGVMKMRFLHLYSAKFIRNKDKEKMERKIAQIFDTIKPGQYFKLDDGTIVKNLADMISALEYMDDKTFKRYCNREKNDFANWAKYVLKNNMLSRELSKVNSKEELLRILKAEPKQKRKLFGLFGDSSYKKKERERLKRQKEKKEDASEQENVSDKPKPRKPVKESIDEAEDLIRK
jgi:ABC-type multidrug transport system permease subunit